MFVTVDNLGQWGILRDGLPHELPMNAWSSGQNVVFREGYAQKCLGHSAAYGDSDVVPYHVAPLQVGTTRWWIEAGLTAIYSVDNAGLHTDITRAAGGAYAATTDGGWTSTTLSGIAVLNNGFDVPQSWGGTGLFQDLENWPQGVTAKSVRAFRNFLVAINITENSGADNYPHMIWWSHPADPGTVPASWEYDDPTRDSGRADLSDHPTELVDGLALGSTLIVYGEGAYWMVQDTGGSQVLRADLISGDMGILAVNCVASTPIGHVVLGQGDVYTHAGGAPQTVLTARARRWLFSNIDASNYARAFVASNPLRNEAWICFPSIGQETCDLALIWNWKDNTLGVRELPQVTHANHGVVDASLATSWDTDLEAWAAATESERWNQVANPPTSTRLVMASASQQLLLADSGSTFAGTAMTSRLERTGLSFDNPDRIKLIRGVRPIIEGSDGGQVQITVGAAMEANEQPTWSSPVTFTIGSDIKADTFASGRFMAIKIESSTSVNWRVKQLAFDGELRGGY